MNWYISIVYCSEIMNFEIINSFGNVNFLIFFVSQNSIIKVGVIIDLDYIVVVVGIRGFKQKVVVCMSCFFYICYYIVGIFVFSDFKNSGISN